MKLVEVARDPTFLCRFHKYAAITWFGIGVFGLVQYLFYLSSHPDPHAFSPIAASVPILFFISVYANVVGHWSSWQAARVEVKQDDENGDSSDDRPEGVD